MQGRKAGAGWIAVIGAGCLLLAGCERRPVDEVAAVAAAREPPVPRVETMNSSGSSGSSGTRGASSSSAADPCGTATPESQ